MMLLKRILFCLFIIVIVAVITGLYNMRDSIKEIDVNAKGVTIDHIQKKYFAKIQTELDKYENSGHEAFKTFDKQSDIANLIKQDNGILVLYKEKTPSSLFIHIDTKGDPDYMLFADTKGLFRTQPAWTSNKNLSTLHTLIEKDFQ